MPSSKGCATLEARRREAGVRSNGRSSIEAPRFGCSDPFTLGVEEEYMLLDPVTFDLVQRATAILAADEDGAFKGRTCCEIFQSEVEGNTPICTSAAQLGLELQRLRAHLGDLVAREGLALAAAGTHPFARYEDQLLTDRPRYHEIVAEVQYPARRELVFGLHVHVGVPDAEAAVRALRALRRHIPDLVALSASSPFWRGLTTGLRSTRQSVFSTFPRSGVPPAFADYREFAAYVEALERAGDLEDYTRIWWDVRPHPRFGTIEVRAMDVCDRIDDAVALAAYVQALVMTGLDSQVPPATALDDALVRENKWQAVRHGLDARVVGDDGRATPMRERILRTLEGLAPSACELGSEDELRAIEGIVRLGTSADRQLARYAQTRDLRVVTQEIARETTAVRRSPHDESVPPPFTNAATLSRMDHAT
jgi:glutamate---cysteine ligase / carboxylate-amine ligase